MINKRVVFTQNNDESNSSYDPTKDPGTGIAQKNLADKKIFTEGKEMAKKEIIKREITNQEKLDQLIKGSKKSLYKTKGIFPFDFFPDTLEIDSEQVHIITRNFFFTKRIHSIAVKDISDVFVDSSLLFATLKIIDRNFIENFITVPFLSKKNAVKARRIIQGLVISSRENIDLSQIHDTELVQKLEALGSVSTTPEL